MSSDLQNKFGQTTMSLCEYEQNDSAAYNERDISSSEFSNNELVMDNDFICSKWTDQKECTEHHHNN